MNNNYEVFTRMAQRALATTLIAIAMLILGSYGRANASAPAQYDIAYAIRVSGTGPMMLKYLGTSGTWQTVNAGLVNGFVQTTGSGLTVNAGPQLSGSAAVASAMANGGALPAGILALSSSNTEVISTGTGQGFRNVP